MLWPLFNYIVWNDATDGRIEKTQWNYYEAVNQKYANLVIEQYQPGDIIWIHDYHLLLVPNMVRAKLPKARIGLFVHSPFPSSEIFRCLPSKCYKNSIYWLYSNTYTFFFKKNIRASRDIKRNVGSKLSWFPGNIYIYIYICTENSQLIHDEFRHMPTRDTLYRLQPEY